MAGEENTVLNPHLLAHPDSDMEQMVQSLLMQEKKEDN